MDIVFKKTHCEVGLQHLDYGQIVGGAQFAPSGLLKLLELGRATGSEFYRRISNSAGEKYNHMFFVKWQQVEVFRSFYERAMGPDKSLDFVNRKARIFHFFLPLGNTSRRMEDWMLDSNTGKPLLTASVLSVNINPETRRPMPFSDFLKRYFNSENCSETPANLKFERLPHSCKNEYKMPDNVVSHTLATRISLRFVDRNNHTNQSVYADTCYDCLADALSKNVFALRGSIFHYKIRRMSLLYLKESGLDDIVLTTAWQDASHDWKFKFHVKKNGAVICQIEIEFYPELKPKL